MNAYNHPRGAICVERNVSGVVVWLALDNQANYREWVGCFSVVEVEA
jgi:hypothetical protein